jgi:hypothetical protein
MSVVDNQERLIAQTQLLYDELLNSAKYAEAIAIGKLILDLSEAYSKLRVVKLLVKLLVKEHSLNLEFILQRKATDQTCHRNHLSIRGLMVSQEL